MQISKYIDFIKELIMPVLGTSENEKINEALKLYVEKIIPFQTHKVLNSK